MVYNIILENEILYGFLFLIYLFITWCENMKNITNSYFDFYFGYNFDMILKLKNDDFYGSQV